MDLRIGKRLASTVCETQVVVVRTSGDSVELCCGGAPMTEDLTAGREGEPAGAFREGTQVGKRYVPVEGEADIELLCTRAGEGTLTRDKIPFTVKEAKPLPSSD